MNLVLAIILLGSSFQVTAYRSVINQTDSSPNYTSTGEHVCGHGVAISPDMFVKRGGPLEYGDIVYIEDIGFKIVNDTTHPRLKKHFDIWVPLYKDEKEHDKRFGKRRLKVWLVQRTLESDGKTQKLKLSDIWKTK